MIGCSPLKYALTTESYHFASATESYHFASLESKGESQTRTLHTVCHLSKGEELYMSRVMEFLS